MWVPIGNLSSFFDNAGPVPVPSSLMPEILSTCFVNKVEITNQSGLSRTVSVIDANSVPLIAPHLLANTETITYTAMHGRRMPGGVLWQADGPGCWGYISGWMT